MAEQVIFDYILPLPSIATSSATKEKEVDEVSWTDRLLITMRHLSERSIDALIGLSGLKSLYVYALFTRRILIYSYSGALTYMMSMLKVVCKTTSVVMLCSINEKLHYFLGWSHWQRRGNDCETIKDFYSAPCRLVWILPPRGLSFKVIDAGTFPDPVKASEDLNAFAKLNEARLYKLFKTCMDAQTDLKGLIKGTVWLLVVSLLIIWPPCYRMNSFEEQSNFPLPSSPPWLSFYTALVIESSTNHQYPHFLNMFKKVKVRRTPTQRHFQRTRWHCWRRCRSIRRRFTSHIWVN